MVLITIFSSDDHPIGVFLKFENEFKNQLQALGFDVLDVSSSRSLQTPLLSFEIFRKSDQAYFNKKNIKITLAMNPSSGWGREPMLFLRLDLNLLDKI
jgi:hypothetical protein